MISNIRQRSCKKVACSTDLPGRSSSCCEDSCLVEIARRECKNECKHGSTIEKSVSDVVADDPITSDSKLQSLPCAPQYKKTKDRYGAILDNLGCICKVLRSLNIESCCVLPSHASRSSNTLALNRAISITEDEKAEDCSKKGCCSSISSPQVDIPVGKAHSITTTTSKNEHCSKLKCCRGDLSQSVVELAVGKVHNYRSKSVETSSNLNGCSEKGCCTKNSSRSIFEDSIQKANDQSESSCCAENVPVEFCCPSVTNITLSAVPNIQGSEIINIDVEDGLSESEHIVLSVHGMTCTSCEQKLYRSLDSFASISNIKTSLVLAQAEFDFIQSSTIDSMSIVKTIEKMTGFSCTKMKQSGEDLDLIVDCNVLDFSNEEDWPTGVMHLAVLGKNSIRVTYSPQIIGARDLFSSPLFRMAKLAPSTASPLIASGRAHVRRSFLMTLLSALLTIPVLILAWAPLPKHEMLYGSISLGLATIVQITIAGPFYIGAFKALIFSRMIEMDLLIVISTTTAYVYSVVAFGYLAAGRPLSTGQFFETSTLLITLIMLGRSVSAFARQRAVESISIESLQISSALLIDPKTNQEYVIDSRLLQYQDTFKVLPDASIVTDGIVIDGETDVDESMITGESMLVTKKPGMTVVAGSINHSGTLIVRLTRLPGENSIKIIAIMVDEAKSSKPRIQKVADRFATYFVPIILFITLVVFLIWIPIGRIIRHQDLATTFINAMTYSISALIVSCPCAIGLAVPMVVVIAGGVAAKHGLIFKSADTIEIARKVSHVIFDKTGTLTQGKLSLEFEEYPTGKPDALAPIILGLTANSKHPVSVAISTHMKSLYIEPVEIKEVMSVAGNGVEGMWNGMSIRGGNPHWLGCQDSPLVERIISTDLTLFCVMMEEELIAVFGLKDILRPDTLETISQLRERSIQISIVSGDNEGAVRSIATLLGVPNSHTRFRCSPKDKQVYVRSMLAQNKCVVMFCGDGTNDAVALAQASIGMHVNGGTDIAQSAADAVIMRPSLRGILVLIDLSKAFYRRVVFNFIWAFVYNVFAILLAAGAFPRARIPPQYAGLGEIVSVLPVIAIAMQLRWAKFH